MPLNESEPPADTWGDEWEAKQMRAVAYDVRKKKVI